MSTLKEFLASADAYARRINRSRVTVSKRLFGDAKTLDRIEEGRQVTVASFERAQRRLAELERVERVARQMRKDAAA